MTLANILSQLLYLWMFPSNQCLAWGSSAPCGPHRINKKKKGDIQSFSSFHFSVSHQTQLLHKYTKSFTALLLLILHLLLYSPHPHSLARLPFDVKLSCHLTGSLKVLHEPPERLDKCFLSKWELISPTASVISGTYIYALIKKSSGGPSMPWRTEEHLWVWRMKCCWKNRCWSQNSAFVALGFQCRGFSYGVK